MGGHAFRLLMPNAIFPRMRPIVYESLKTRLVPILQSFYAHAVVAPESPGKPSYGDLDVVVTGPREGFSHEDLKSALRATCSIPQDGPRTSNFAIPADAFEEVRAAREHTPDEEANDAARAEDVFIQVDVHVCEDHAQWERTVFYTSYSDLGFVLGLLAQSAGLSFTIFGLRLARPIETFPPRQYYLSTSMADILAFFGLSMDRWTQGFATEADIFEWVAASPFVRSLAAHYRAPEYQPSIKKRVDARPMRLHFAAFLQQQYECAGGGGGLFAEPGREDEKVQAALRHFGKHEEHARILYLTRAERRAKGILNGTNVQDWTGAKGVPVKFVMDEVKARLPGCVTAFKEENPELADLPEWQRALLEMPDDEVRTLTMAVKDELQASGKLVYDWRSAKAAKLEKKRQLSLEKNGPSVSEDGSTTVAVVA